MRKLGKVGALERIGRRDRSDGDPHIQRSQHHQRMVNPVGGDNRERTIRSESVGEQILGERQCRLASFAVANGPLAFAVCSMRKSRSGASRAQRSSQSPIRWS